ncbi:hypothetical protein FRC01_005453, partial [Tulasnella sp. 417]
MSDNQPSRVSFTVRRPSPVSSRQSSAGPETNAATPTPSFRIPPPPRQQAGYSTAPSRLKYEQTEQEEVDSSDEEDPEAAELVSGFDSMGVQRWVNLFSCTKELTQSRTNNQHLLRHRVKPLAKTNGPLVIPALKNRDWRQLARQRQAANGYIPDSARASAITGPDGSQGGLGTRDSINSGPQLTGLIFNKRSTLPAEPAADEPHEPEPAADGDTEMIPAKPLTEDEIALQALLRGTDETASKPQVAAIPLAPMTEEAALERDMADLPDTATLEDYARVPIEQFGMAMLRGMGWKPPKNGEEELWLPTERPALLGLGAKARPAAQGSGGAKGQAANWKNAERKYVPLVKKDRNGDIVDDAKDSASSRPRSGQASRRNSRSRSPHGRSDSSRRDRDREHRDRDRDYRDRDRGDRGGERVHRRDRERDRESDRAKERESDSARDRHDRDGRRERERDDDRRRKDRERDIIRKYYIQDESKLRVDGLGDDAPKRKDGYGVYDSANYCVDRPVQKNEAGLQIILREAGAAGSRFYRVTCPLGGQLRFVESFLNHHDVGTLAAMVQSKSKVDAEADRVIADLRLCHDELKQKLQSEAVEVEPRCDLYEDQMLDRGGYSDIFLGHWRPIGSGEMQPVAVKHLRPKGIDLDHTKDSDIRERMRKDNILVNDALEAVLADFGQSRFIHDIPSPYVTEDILLGTPRYMAPELMEDETAQHTLASDIYAFSLVTLE